MQKKYFALSIFIISLIFLGISGIASAAVGPKNGDTWVPAPTGPAPVDKDPLTVSDMVVDKTATNPVDARNQAIADAPAMAFRKLAERNMTDKQLKSLKIPKDVASLVQDFEIHGEQMSSTRYVAKFTVRFSDAVRNYMDIHETPVAQAPQPGAPGAAVTGPQDEAAADAGAYDDEAMADEADEDGAGGADAQPQDHVVWNDEAGKPYSPDATGREPLGKTVLILPYYENLAGQTVLWEDPNPWRRIWQNALPSATVGGSQLVVPLGDVSDIATGPANAVWSGDYGAIEKLRRNYNADEVVLLAANKSGSSMTVDVYTYQQGKFRHRGAITPYVGDKTEVEAFRQALADTLRYLASGKQDLSSNGRPALETISREVTHQTQMKATVVDGQTPPSAHPPGTLILKPENAEPQVYQESPPPQAYAFPGQPVYAPPGQAVYAPPPGAYAAQPAGRVQLAATAIFRNFQAWVELQKRLGSMAPMVDVDIRSINSNSAQVTLSYSSSLDALRGELASRGIMLGAPMGGNAGYSLQLAN